MSRHRNSLALALGVAGLATGMITYFQPPHLTKHQPAVSQEVSNLSDVDQDQKERLRRDGHAHLQAENDRRLRPGEHRLPQPRIRLRLR